MATITTSKFSPVFLRSYSDDEGSQYNQYFPPWSMRGEPSCNFANDRFKCITLGDETELSFQYIISFDTPEAATAFLAAPNSYIGYVEQNINTLEENEITPLVDYIAIPETNNVLALVATVPFTPGACFAFGIKGGEYEDIGTIFDYVSFDCYMIVEEVTDLMACETTVIRFRSNENSFGFNYCLPYSGPVSDQFGNLFYNTIRLPFMLTRPQFPEEKSTFRFADGRQKIVESIVRKTLQLDTDYMPETWHQMLKIGLSHDDVVVNTRAGGPAYNDGELFSIVPEDDYSIAWHDRILSDYATAQTKISITPFEANNPNCSTCEPVPECLIVAENFAYAVKGAIVLVVGESYLIPMGDAVISLMECGSVEFSSPVGLDASIEIVDQDELGNIIINVVGLPDYSATGGNPNLTNLFNLEISCADNPDCDPVTVQFIATVWTEPCLPVVEIDVEEITGESVSGIVSVLIDGPLPGCDTILELFAADDLVTPLQTLTIVSSDAEYPDFEYPFTFEGLDPETDYVLRATNDCCDGDLSEPLDEPFTTIETPPPSTQIDDVCRGPNDLTVCACGTQTTVYVAAPDTEITIGASVYLNMALTITVPDGFIVDPGSDIIYVISGGVVTSDTGNTC